VPEQLSIEKTKKETQKHIDQVAGYIALAITDLHKRMNNHDASKLESPEIEGFTKYTAQLKGLTYGSEEYTQSLKDMEPTIKHHYSHNSHHPEFYENGIDGMTLIDLMEMICDWISATKRHQDGNIKKSIEINEKRFKISPQLLQIIKNTVELLENIPFKKEIK